MVITTNIDILLPTDEISNMKTNITILTIILTNSSINKNEKNDINNETNNNIPPTNEILKADTNGYILKINTTDSSVKKNHN